MFQDNYLVSRELEHLFVLDASLLKNPLWLLFQM